MKSAIEDSGNTRLLSALEVVWWSAGSDNLAWTVHGMSMLFSGEVREELNFLSEIAAKLYFFPVREVKKCA